jgi:quinohemoprotein ethanol dehydrogenase
MRAWRWPVLALVVAVNAAVVLTASASKEAAAPLPAPAFTPEETVAFPADNWIGYNGNGYNTRHSTLNQISTANVKALKIAWRQQMKIPGLKYKPGAFGTFAEATPVIYGGVIYVPDTGNNVWALDASTGERIWVHRTKQKKLAGLGASFPTRGLTVADGKVFLAAADASIQALNQSTGRVVWRKVVANNLAGHTFTNAPLYVDGKIITGSSGGDSGAPGFVVALNATNGRELWRFQVIPQKPSDPGWSSWPKKRAYNGGGAMWNVPAVDPQLGLIYLVTGNPIPYSGIKRGRGKELFTDSILALDMRTGKLRWHFQTTHHDIWDYDATNAAILFDLPINGRLRKGIVHAGKTGFLYILDRQTGKPILGIREKKVPQAPRSNTYPTQPIPVGQPFSTVCPDWKFWKNKKGPDGKKYRVGCIYEAYDDTRFTVTAPAALGGANWPPSAYSPSTGYMYICSKDSEFVVKSIPAKKQKLQRLGEFGQIEGLTPGEGIPTRPTHGRLVAMNLRSNRIVWQVKWPKDLCYSGVLSTSGNLVFVGRNKGYLEAYDSRNGKLVWRSPKLKAGVNAAPASYTVNGKQYIAVFAGGNGIASVFGGIKPFYGASLYTFALPG